MERTEWNERFIKRLEDHYKFEHDFSKDIAEASDNLFEEFPDDPEDAADEEMSYWGD